MPTRGSALNCSEAHPITTGSACPPSGRRSGSTRRPESVLIGQAPKSRDTVESVVQTNKRFPVIPAKSGNPVIVFPQTVPCADKLSVDVRSRLGNASVQGVNFPVLEVRPGLRRAGENNGDLGHRNNGRPDCLTPMVGKKGPGRSTLPGPVFVEQVDQKSSVRDHLRPPERRPRPLRTFSSSPGSMFGGGSCLWASKISPQVSRGL